DLEDEVGVVDPGERHAQGPGLRNRHLVDVPVVGLVDPAAHGARQRQRLAARPGVVRLLLLDWRLADRVGQLVDDDHRRAGVARALGELDLLRPRRRGAAGEQRKQRQPAHYFLAIVARSSASQTSCPATFASPRNFQTAPPFRSGTSSRMSWSPGTTVFRNLALSMAMK